MPCYGVEKFLPRCMESLTNQTLKDIEIILVDDESPDRVPQMCDEYARQDSRIKVVHKKNGGLGFARNSGLDVATGEYVTFVDSDDIIELNAYERLCAEADNEKLDIIRFTCNRFKDDGSHSATRYDAPLYVLDQQEKIRQVALQIFDDRENRKQDVPHGGSSCMALFRRSVIEKNNLRFVSEREYISEDFIFCFLSYLYSNRVGWLANTYYHYRVNWSSLTRTVRQDKMHRACEYSKAVEKLILQNGYDRDARSYAWGYCIGVSRLSTKSIFMSNMKIGEKKKWFDDNMSDSYFRKIVSLYPKHLLPIKQRICLWAMVNKLFFVSYALIVGFSKIRTNRFK